MLETLLNREGRAMGEYGEWEKRGKRSGEGIRGDGKEGKMGEEEE